MPPTSSCMATSVADRSHRAEAPRTWLCSGKPGVDQARRAESESELIMARGTLPAARRRILQMIKCRAYGHRWEDLGWLALVSKGTRLWSQQFRCDRCDMLRNDRRTHSTMALDSRTYDKPSGYPGRLP